jgi:RNA polymerase sigma-70 factor, ECF subfamily
MELSEEQVFLLLEQTADKTKRSECERALERLYLEFHKPVRNYIWKSISQDPSLIEEVVQDTFFEVWQHGERFRGEAKFKTWLLSIARHKALDSLRKRGIAHEPLETVEDTLVSLDDSITDTIQKEQIQEVVRFCLERLSAIGKLSLAHKEVLHLAYIEDQDISEIAQITGCPESTVKTRLFYARQQIKKCLKNRLLLGENGNG